PVGWEDPDGDGFFGSCDNCPDDYNPGQEDCNDDGEGNACEPADEQDDDGDGTCNGVDGCPDDPNKIDPGQCGCGNSDTDTDYDGVADCLDECDNNPVWQVEPACGCDSTPYDNEDDDGDGFENCFDTCAGVDDAVFGPCDDAIPTVSEWGLLIMALLLLVAGKVYFARRPELG
ncbi:MAG: IPTL-CTERM sorting domain-containing protein, partial [Phycisphaerales bacterium]